MRMTRFILRSAAVLAAACVLAGEPEKQADKLNIDNVVIVLDASGSMDKPMGGVKKIDAAKTALKTVLKTIPASTHVGLLVFSASNVQDWAYPLGPRDDAKLNAAIDLPAPYGNTPLGTYMKIGADRLLQARKAQFGYGTYRLLVVTDGEANQEPINLVEVNTKDIMSRGITVDAIGVAMGRKHTLAKKSNSYRSADNPESLQKAITEVFAEVGKQQAQSMEDDAFAIIAGLPDEFAAEIVKTLTSQSNDPIGQKKVAPVQPQQQPAGQPAARPAAQPQPQTQTGGQEKKSDGKAVWIIITAVVVLAIIFKKKR
jgi:Ca-activated chloride channel family protein